MTGRYQVPAAVQPLTDQRGIITNPWWQWALSIGKNAGDPIEWANIVNTPTTLGGYGITDAYTQTQINTMFGDLATVYQPLSSNLTAYAGGSLPSAFTLGIVDSADAATWRAAIGAGTSSFDGSYGSLSGIPAILSEFTGLSDASGVLTNDGSGNLSWGPAGTTYTAGDGLSLASDEFSVDEAFNFAWTGTHDFTGTVAYAGTTTGWSIGRDATYPSMWAYRDAASTNEKRWAWYNGLQAGGAIQLLAWNDDSNVYRAAFGAFRSGVAITDIELGNSTDSPRINLYGPVYFRSGMWHKDWEGVNRFWFDTGGRSYFASPVTGGNPAYEWYNGSGTTIAQMRGDGYLRTPGMLSITGPDARQVYFNEGYHTYGSAGVYGKVNGYAGLVINDGTVYPTLMCDSSIFGVFVQGGSPYWAWFCDGSYFQAGLKVIDYSGGLPYTRVVSGGSSAGGNITISTSAPSGTPADGDIWIQRAA